MFSINKRNVSNVGPTVCLTPWHQSGQHSSLNTLKYSLFSQTKSIFRTELCRSSVQSFGRKHPGSASSLAEEYDLSQGTVEVSSSRATHKDWKPEPYRVGELVGDELPHQSDGRRSLLSDLKEKHC